MRPYIICHMLSSVDGKIDGDHLICAVSERAPEDYLSMLQKKGISYIVTGATSVDMVQAVSLLSEHFGIKTLLLKLKSVELRKNDTLWIHFTDSLDGHVERMNFAVYMKFANTARDELSVLRAEVQNKNVNATGH